MGGHHVKESILFALAAVALSASAASSASLIGTGFTSGGATQTPGLAEGNWTAVSSISDPTTIPLTVVTNEGDYGGVWVNPYTSPLGITAQWITPYTGRFETLADNDPLSNDPSQPNVTYTYTLNNVTKPGGEVTLNWASDNGGVFLINNVKVAEILAPGINDKPYDPFTTTILTLADVNTLFDQTLNTVQFVITNLQFKGLNPTGLIADFKVSAVPLPPALLLFGSALAGLNWLRRRRRSDGSVALAAI